MSSECGAGPSCDAAKEQCISGHCLLKDGQTCTANADCAHSCLAKKCAPRGDVLEGCDKTDGAPPSTEDDGNGDDADCLDGLGCDSGTCKRVLFTNCATNGQCLSGLCHKGKCTSQNGGTCRAFSCGAPAGGACAPTTTAENKCSYNHVPAPACTVNATSCDTSCACQLN